MEFKKTAPKAETEEKVNDLEPIAEDKLGEVNGAGNPWENVKGVPQKPIDDDLRDRV